MRRFLILLLAALLLAPAPAMAQQFRTIGAGGVLDWNSASTSCSNNVAECTLYSYTIPVANVATATTSTVLPGATTSGFNWIGSVPLHLRLHGRINTNPSNEATGVANMGANFGGTTATITLLNANTLSSGLSFRAWSADIYIQPFASLTGQNTVKVLGKFETATRTTDNQTAPVLPIVNPTYYGQVVGTTSLRSAQTLSVVWRWGSASHTNSIIVDGAALVIGN